MYFAPAFGVDEMVKRTFKSILIQVGNATNVEMFKGMNAYARHCI